MQVGGLAERYAKALLDIDKGKLSLEALQQEISEFAGLYANSSDFRMLLENPSFSIEERKAVLKVITDKAKASPIARNFLFLLCDKERTRFLPDIAKALERHTDLQSGIVRAKVESATPLSKKQTEALSKALSELKGKPVRVSTGVRSNLMGGVVVEMDGKVYDGSIRKRLETIRESILRETR